MKCTHKYTEALLMRFDNHRCLPRSEGVNIFEHMVIWPRLYHVFRYIYSLLIEKDICDCWNVSLCLCVPFIQRYLYVFGKSFLFIFLFLCYPYFGTFPFHVISNFKTVVLCYCCKQLNSVMWNFKINSVSRGNNFVIMFDISLYCFSAPLDTHMPYPDSLNASMALQASTPRAVSEEDISR